MFLHKWIALSVAPRMPQDNGFFQHRTAKKCIKIQNRNECYCRPQGWYLSLKNTRIITSKSSAIIVHFSILKIHRHYSKWLLHFIANPEIDLACEYNRTIFPSLQLIWMNIWMINFNIHILIYISTIRFIFKLGLLIISIFYKQQF